MVAAKRQKDELVKSQKKNLTKGQEQELAKRNKGSLVRRCGGFMDLQSLSTVFFSYYSPSGRLPYG